MTDAVHILLVDDEPKNLDALEAILEDPAYHLLRATSADAALKQLLDHEVAAIVLDIKMPGMSGFELAQIIKGTRKFRQVPILFLTAYMIDEVDVIAGYGAGAVDYLTKPINPQILRHKVAVFADLFCKTRALAELNETLEKRVKERTTELERSEAALRAAARQKDEFIAILAHELRNPLAPLRMGVDILMQHVHSDLPLVGKAIAAMNRQVDHMVRLIDDLLDISRLTRGVLELKRERTDLAPIITTAVENARPFFAKRGQAVDVSVAGPVFANADATRIAQVLGNLLHNASKFTSDGGAIHVELTADGVIRVVDSGEGIPPDQIERVFDMFARVEDRSSKAERGLGIGLALARRLAEMHDGSLTASSAGKGRGTTFTFSIPVAAPVSEAARAAPAVAPPGATLKILVIEDNDDIAMTMSGWLESMGHRVWTAPSGERGVELIVEHRPALVLCDLGLPEMDGLEVCKRVRTLKIETQPVMVALTGWGRDDDRRRTKEAGFDGHLVKPVAAEKLRQLLRSVAP
jgi:signal transduction histidine kinase